MSSENRKKKQKPRVAEIRKFQGNLVHEKNGNSEMRKTKEKNKGMEWVEGRVTTLTTLDPGKHGQPNHVLCQVDHSFE